MKLSFKLSIGAMLISIIPVLGVSALAFYSARTALNGHIYKGLDSMANEQISSIEQILGRAATNLSTWSKLLILQDVLTDDEEGDTSNELAQLLEQYNFFTELIATNDRGIVVASANPELIGLDLSATSAFHSNQAGAVYQSSVIESTHSGVPALILAEPIHADYDYDTVIGSVIGYLDWNHLQAVLSKTKVLGTMQDAAHRLILISNSEHLVLYDTIKDPAASGSMSLFDLPTLNGVQPIRLLGKEYLIGTASTRGFEAFKDPAWTFHALISNEAAFESVQLLRERIIGLTLLIATIVLVIATQVARSFVRPLVRLAQVAGKITTGNFKTPLPAPRSDEIGDLTLSFDTMRNAVLEHQIKLLREVDGHKKTETNLRSSENRLNAAQKLSRMAHWNYDSANNLFEGSDQLVKIFGIKDGRLDSMSAYLSHIHADDRHQVEVCIGDAQKNKKAGNIEFNLIRQDGTQISVRQDIEIGESTNDTIFGTIQDISRQRDAERQIREMAYFDTLTGLSNRSYFMQHLEDTIKKAFRHNSQFALLFLDLDGFKDVNDSLGHDAGDNLLKVVARRLNAALRDSDFIARLGGDEFCILIEDVGGEGSAAKTATSCLNALNKPFEVSGRTLRPRGSIGIAYYPNDAESVQELIKTADSAMYAAKEAGKHCYVFYNKTMSQLADQRLMLEQELRNAIENNEFELLYQPQISALSGELVAVEALARWNHPKRGMVSPVEFIPVLEKIGLIHSFGNWVLQTACNQLVTWSQEGLDDIRMAVNVSPLQFSDGSVTRNVAQILSSTGIRPEKLDIEITESVVQTADKIVTNLRDLKLLGVKISIDDFGTGYSCLASLKNLPLDTLKIDRLFVKDILKNPKSAVLCGTIIGMAHAMGYEVVAEGVETMDQARSLVGFNCDLLQGYYFSRPVEAVQIPQLANVDLRQNLESEAAVKTG